MSSSRRVLITCGLAGAAPCAGSAASWPAAAERRFHLSISEDALDADADLLKLVARAGVTDIWLTGYLYGYWYYTVERIQAWAQRVEKAGLAVHVINVPLGHPGDSLGAMQGNVPLTPPKHWRLAVDHDGRTHAGTSLHAPATEENAGSLRRLKDIGIRHVFLDDDFRLARSPGAIGGCFCDQHRRSFLQQTGLADSRWMELIENVRRRRLTPLLREWVRFCCDELTASFRAQQKAAEPIVLGNMVMYLGAEKAGIRLADYRGVPLRVGELMFDDRSFAPVKGKTDELFSCLFHRRYVEPSLAYSETTAYPADRLSARNMAAKLAISTLADVRHTMYMSGLTAFPRTHWDVLVPAMKRHAAIHRKVAGHAPRGPLKHYWGEASRLVGDDRPYSLFLAMGIPFEVTDTPATDGYTFLSDFDARAAMAGGLKSAGTVFIIRPQNGSGPAGVRPVAESREQLTALKSELLPRFGGVPCILDDVPVVCAWYPTARAVVLWNLTEQHQKLTLSFNSARRQVSVDALDAALIEDL